MFLIMPFTAGKEVLDKDNPGRFNKEASESYRSLNSVYIERGFECPKI